MIIDIIYIDHLEYIIDLCLLIIIINYWDVLLEGNWDEYRDNYNISGTKNLFMIPFESDVTEADIRKTEQVLDFYVGGFEGITEANKYSLIDMFTDSGFRHGTYRLINLLVERGMKADYWVTPGQRCCFMP